MLDAIQNANANANVYTPRAQQLNFKSLMNAFAYPGRIQNMHYKSAALEQILATLIDGEVALADPDDLLNYDQRMRLEASMSTPEQAHFVVCSAHNPPSFQPQLGTLEEPEHGATVILQVQGFDAAKGAIKLNLQGPGIDSELSVPVQGLNASWLQQRAAWNTSFPMGVDFILVSAHQLIALPRTTHIQGEF